MGIIRVTKNLRMWCDCHEAFRLFSAIAHCGEGSQILNRKNKASSSSWSPNSKKKFSRTLGERERAAIGIGIAGGYLELPCKQEEDLALGLVAELANREFSFRFHVLPANGSIISGLCYSSMENELVC
ncbi:hypothetical protein ABZP36_034635 [Zizania latifolia]